MIKVELLTKEHCPLCDEAALTMKELQSEFNFEVKMVDIYKDDLLLETYQLMIPVVRINGEDVDFGQVSKQKVREYLRGS